MEKFKVSFEANNQQLKSIGTKHASDTYADIEATFVLGEKWTDMDSVSAVWWNDFTRVATVLDSQGKCIVPHEVLTRKGYVRVNLVGSVVENGELVTRLTSYSAEAVKVNEKIKLTGSETSEITPSQYEQFVANVKADADRAEAGATASANSAQNASESATASANSASDSAQSAIASAQSAQNASESAITAENAKDDAEDARDKILSMRATAETLEAGSDATASYSDGLLTLGIPRGDKGEQGIQGETGATPNLTIGTVETLAPTEDATASITGTAENPVLNLGLPKGDTGEVSLEDLEALLPTDTASGEIVTITDGQSVVPAKSLKVELEPIQDLHGYDKPWSAGAGKNKFDVDAWIALGRNNTYYSVSDSVVSVIANDVGGIGDRTIQLKPSTQYVISFTNASDCRVFDDAGNTLVQTSNQTSATFTTTTSGQIAVKFYGSTYPTVIGKVQIEEGSTATSWTPYSNICPISGRTEVVTSVSGFNVWDEEWELGNIDFSNGQPISATDRIRSKNFNPCIPNTLYYIKEPTTTKNVRIAYYDESKSYVGESGWSGNQLRTTPSNAFYFKLACGSAYGTTYNNDISINYPSTDHDYHAYEGETYTTDLGQTVYGGTLDVVTGELVVDRAMVDLGSLSWNRQASSGMVDRYMSAGIASTVLRQGITMLDLLSSSFVADNDVVYDRQKDGAMAVLSSTGGLYISASGYTSATAFTEGVSGQTLVYPLATPQTIQLTPQQVQLLLGTNNVWSDGDVTMTYNADIQLWVEKKLS